MKDQHELEATIKKLNKKIEAELEKKYSKLMGGNSKIVANAAKKELTRITEKIHKKIVTAGSKEIQNIVVVYEEAIKNSRNAIVELNDKLKEIDAKTDKLKSSGKLPKDFIDVQSKKIEKKISELQTQTLAQEKEKQKAVKAYIANNSKIQESEKASLEMTYKSLLNVKKSGSRIAELQLKIANAEKDAQKEKKAREEKKDTFGGFKSTVGDLVSSQGFGFKQERAVLSGLFSPITNVLASVKKNRSDKANEEKVLQIDKDRSELNTLLESLKTNSEIYDEVGKQLGNIVPSLSKLTEKQPPTIAAIEKENIRRSPSPTYIGKIKNSVTEPSPSYSVGGHSSVSSTLFVNEQKITNVWLQRIHTLLKYADDKNKKSEGGFLSKAAGFIATALGLKLLPKLLTKAVPKVVPKILKSVPKFFKKTGTATKKIGASIIKKTGTATKKIGASIIKKTGTATKKISSSMAKKSVTPLLKTAGKVGGKTLLKRVPIVGGAISAGLNYMEHGSVARAAGAGLGSTGGAMAGAALGATVGSVVPLVGTVIGGLLGGILGGIVGDAIGDAIGSKLESSPNAAKSLNSPMAYNSDNIRSNMESGSYTGLNQQPAVKIAQDNGESIAESIFGDMDKFKSFLKDDFAGALASKIFGEFKSGTPEDVGGFSTNSIFNFGRGRS